MSFYQDLSSYYDRIFPLNSVALSFVSRYAQKGDVILDMGAGTGNMAIALAENGLKVTASEPEKTMAESIRSKAEEKGLSVSVHTKSMEGIDQFLENFNVIVTLGNTLPHLQSLELIESYFHKCYMKLKENGILIIQQVNYDKVLSRDDFSFPVIEREDFTFTRYYQKNNDHILFTSKLTVNGEETENTIPLYPITSENLRLLLKKGGFHSVETYGNFKGEPYTIDSPALVVVAKK